MSTTERSAAAVGLSYFAAVMLIIIGVFEFLAGISGVVKHHTTVYAATSNASYVFHLSTTGWGWVHIILGIVIFLAGLGILSGQVWARTVGVVLAGISAIANFAFIPIQPVWAIVLIALDVAVIWALTSHGRDIVA